MFSRPVYPMGVVAELLDVHPETIRTWERYGVVHPHRRGGKRFYSDLDLKRLQFMQKLTEEGLNLPAICHYLRLYPCWELDDCPGCMRRSKHTSCAKVCWKEEGVYCEVYGDPNACLNCELRERHQQGNSTATEEAA